MHRRAIAPALIGNIRSRRFGASPNKLAEIAWHQDCSSAGHMLTAIDQERLVDVTGGGALHTTGRVVGFGAGVAVTAGLGLSPRWSTQVPGKPAGFQRRHEAVLGPKVTAFSNRLSRGPAKEFTAGVGAGATEAPGWSFRHGL